MGILQNKCRTTGEKALAYRGKGGQNTGTAFPALRLGVVRYLLRYARKRPKQGPCDPKSVDEVSKRAFWDFSRDAAFLLTVASFPLTDELLCLQLFCSALLLAPGAFSLTVGAFLLTWSSFADSWSFFAYCV